MPTFAYLATTAEGRTLRGSEEAVSAATLQRALVGRGLYPLEVALARPEDDRGRRSRGGWLLSRHADVTEALATLASLLEAGLPLDRCLEVAARGAARADVAAALESARARVREGGRLADALAEQPRFFPAVAAGMIRAGERGGHLTDGVRRLAEHLERERALRAKLLSAMLYPLLLVGVGAVALAVLLGGVIPRFTELLGDAGAELPASTRALLAATSVFSRFWPLLLVGGGGERRHRGGAAATVPGTRRGSRERRHCGAVHPGLAGRG